jgi:hypothetical protein
MIKLDSDSKICLSIGVVGSSTYKDNDLVLAWLDRIHKELGPFDKLITGGVGSVDTVAEKWASFNKIEKKIYYADWKTHGKKAVYIRNIFIVENSDLVITFWDGDSKGTAHAIRITRVGNKPLLVINNNGGINEFLSTIKLSD